MGIGQRYNSKPLISALFKFELMSVYDG
jgi:hypothetical protein